MTGNDAAAYIPADAPGWDEVMALLYDESICKITYDAKIAANACHAARQSLRGLAFDVVLAAYLLNPAASEYSLKLLSEEYLAG